MVEGYVLQPGVPTVMDYLRLRADSGLTPKRTDQATVGLPGSWWACHVVHQTSGTVVGMGRILGDGGWYFHIVDVAVDPAHQRQGLGDAIMTALLAHIDEVAPPGAWVTLLADPPGRRLYEKHGFTPTAPESIGMGRMLRG